MNSCAVVDLHALQYLVQPAILGEADLTMTVQKSFPLIWEKQEKERLK